MCKWIARLGKLFKSVTMIIYRYRSAITGRYVSKEFAEANKETTVKEEYEK